jgi:hypothetical protein
VYGKVRKDLASILTGQSLFYCFENQIKILRKSIFTDFEKQVIQGCSQKDQINENFSEITTEGYNNSIKRFKKLSESLIVDGTSWGQQVIADEAELASQIYSLINNAREKEIDKLQMLTQLAAKDSLEQIINKPIYDLDSDFWEQMRVPFVREMTEISTSNA